ncbi:BlaI/MecI/CopY family transcriptional regulator [Pseudomarimonas arenosa]|uniref:BlaI/MecI/CopY family transcriptional regulator n=1 Tax=Pseudomarimonas arenosa TaxID=2774145 RepID=A0AAW3ZLT5_9GAMM|nr:BlaI/MecI/CopY family transcriptional regulator [Pseudomarimonas arenosa]
MQISEAESRVMSVLWESGAATADEVFQAIGAQEGWQEPTVKTLLNRLLGKGAVRAEAEGRRYRYHPLLKREDWVLEESQGLLGRLFNGRVAPMVAYFSKHGQLSGRDVAELKRLIDQLESGERDD